LNRKFRCNKGVQKVSVDASEVSVDAFKVSVDASKVSVDASKVSVDAFKVSVDENMVCGKCKKIFSRKSILYNHELTCTGLSSLQCETCHKFFSCKQNKYRHKRDVLCYPPPPPPPLPHAEPSAHDALITTSEMDTTTMHNQQPTSLTNTTTTNSNNNQITTNSHSNNTVNNVNNIIQYNTFGDEGIEQLGKFLSGRKDDAKIIEHMRQLGKKKIYGIRDIQNDIFFNPDNPEGFSIIKPEKYGSSVRVRNSEGIVTHDMSLLFVKYNNHNKKYT
jgi:hypothetical protein